jgi:hypothetical protein
VREKWLVCLASCGSGHDRERVNAALSSTIQRLLCNAMYLTLLLVDTMLDVNLYRSLGTLVVLC